MFLYSALLFLSQLAKAHIVGKGLKCSEEGAFVDIANATRGMVTSPCYRCLCKKGQVECILEKCKNIGKCFLAQQSSLNVCCPSCLTCTFLERKRQNNEVWTDQQDSCSQFICKDGVVTKWRKKCLDYCDKGILVPSYCCRLCKYRPSTNDPCVQCDVANSQYFHCYRIACPVLGCPVEHQMKNSCRCCMKCVSYPKRVLPIVHSTEKKKQFCTFRKKKYSQDEKIVIDACTKCVCDQGTIYCRRFTCPYRPCDPARLFYRRNACCAFCSITPRNCEVQFTNGTRSIMQHGSHWDGGNCTRCFCRKSRIYCKKEKCEWKDRCPRGKRIKWIHGSCCHSCELKEGTCTVFGDPHYITFDRLGYSFQGSCSYVLSQHCALRGEVPEFVIVAQNAKVGRHLKTHCVSVFVSLLNGTVFDIHLLSNKTVYEKNQEISLPYVRYEDWPEYRVFEDPINSNIILSLSTMGVKISWDGQSFVEIILSKKHQSSVCGLCGNFNGNAEDDLWPRHGSAATKSITKFANSWRYGKQCYKKSRPRNCNRQG